MNPNTTFDGEYIPLGLRNHRVTKIAWTEDAVVITLTPAARITVGRGALLTTDPIDTDTPRTSLGQTPHREVEQLVGAIVSSSGAWTSGQMYIAFEHPARHLTITREGTFVPARVEIGGRPAWTRSR